MRQILLLIVLFFASSWVARKIRQAQARGDGDAAVKSLVDFVESSQRGIIR